MIYISQNYSRTFIWVFFKNKTLKVFWYGFPPPFLQQIDWLWINDLPNGCHYDMKSKYSGSCFAWTKPHTCTNKQNFCIHNISYKYTNILLFVVNNVLRSAILPKSVWPIAIHIFSGHYHEKMHEAFINLIWSIFFNFCTKKGGNLVPRFPHFLNYASLTLLVILVIC